PVAENGRGCRVIGQFLIEGVDEVLVGVFDPLCALRQALVVGLAPVEKAQALAQLFQIWSDVLEQVLEFLFVAHFDLVLYSAQKKAPLAALPRRKAASGALSCRPCVLPGKAGLRKGRNLLRLAFTALPQRGQLLTQLAQALAQLGQLPRLEGVPGAFQNLDGVVKAALHITEATLRQTLQPATQRLLLAAVEAVDDLAMRCLLAQQMGDLPAGCRVRQAEQQVGTRHDGRAMCQMAINTSARPLAIY